MPVRLRTESFREMLNTTSGLSRRNESNVDCLEAVNLLLVFSEAIRASESTSGLSDLAQRNWNVQPRSVCSQRSARKHIFHAAMAALSQILKMGRSQLHPLIFDSVVHLRLIKYSIVFLGVPFALTAVDPQLRLDAGSG